MRPAIRSLSIKNFGVLQRVRVGLGPLNVLVGPNGSGKSTLLRVIQFLGDAARRQLDPVVDEMGGLKRITTRTRSDVRARVEITVQAMVTRYAHPGALDEYQLTLRPLKGESFAHAERFTFKRTARQGRRITLSGGNLHIDTGARQRSLELAKDAFGLAVLPQLGDAEGAQEVRKLQELFTTFRVFDIDARAARRPSALRDRSRLRADAANLAAFLGYLKDEHEDLFLGLEQDARLMIPGFQRIHLRAIGGPGEAVSVEVEDRGLPGATPLADASFGTVRALALLAMFYDPKPPLLTCVEEIDHGFHPYVFDRLAELMREASARTQFIIATHSPALVNRLKPSELIVCERDEQTNLARIPAISAAKVARAASAGDLRLGELWFSGVLGGVPQ